MGKKEIKHPEKQAATGAYSSGVLVDGWLYVSGQGPLDYQSGKVVEGSTAEQTRLTLRHIEKILQEAGCSMDDVVKCTCFLSDIGDFDEFNAAYAECFSGVRPARTTVEARLWGGIKVEIDAVARVRER